MSVAIAQLANFVGPTSGGVKTALDALGRGYVEAGARRLLVLPGPVDEVVSDGANRVVQLRGPQVGGGYRLVVEPWRVIELLTDFGPTSLELSDKSTFVPLTSWARRRQLPSVLFSHERLDAMLTLRSGWVRSGWVRGVGHGVGLLYRLLARQFDAIVTTSRYAAAEYPLATQAKVHHVPLGVDLDTFRPAVVRPPRTDGVLRLVHVGRLSREKSPHLAARTALALHRRGVPTRLDVYGDGPHRRELEAEADGAPVRFHGHLADRSALAATISAADVALSVCPGETFGLAVLEALACGVPVVTADRGGGRELVDVRCGAWAPPDPEQLADAVLRLAGRDRGALRRAARERAETYPWAASVDAMLHLHRSLADRCGFSHTD
ncbi:MAG: glycosyltransferase [Actinomycetota bacterium]|nr:glycosyltransferase [Actinomycetota bacterium]